MKKVLSILLFILILIPIPMTVRGQDNLILNGTFDTDMNNWNLATSTNFSISSNNGVCDFNTTHTDWLNDYDATLLNATTYNMTIRSGDPSIQGLSYYVDSDNTTTNILNATFDNGTFDGFDYRIDGELREYYMRVNNSDMFNLSAPNSLAVETTKTYNITEFQENFNGTETGYDLGFGDQDFTWGNNELDCYFQGNRDSYHIWNITPRTNNQKAFGIRYEIRADPSFLQNNSYILFGYGNINNIGVNVSNQVLGIIRIYNTSISIPMCHIRNQYNVGYQISGSTVHNNFNTSLFATGIIVEIFSGQNSLFTMNIYNIQTGIKIISMGGGGLIDIDLNCINARNYWIPSTVAQCNITNVTSWINPINSVTYGESSLMYNITLPQDSGRLAMESNRHHYHDAQNGVVKSSVNLYPEGQAKITRDNRTTTSNPSASTWYNNQIDYRNAPQNSTLQLWNYFSLVEGSTTFPAKGVYWDDISVDVINYDRNATYRSQIFDRGYYADWRDIILYFDGYGASPFSNLTNNIFSIDVYTRVGESPTIDATWSAWNVATGFGFAEVGSPPYDQYYYSGDINSKNGQYIQYRIEIEMNTTSFDSVKFVYGALSSVPIDISIEWGEMVQTITKPYTNYTTLNYDYRIIDLENALNGTIKVWFGDELVALHNYTFFETNWQTISIPLPNVFNSSGTYPLRFQSYNRFNSTNGSATIWFDNVQVLIESQAPFITEYTVYNGTEITFNGTFKDLTRGSNFDYLGEDGIESVIIAINGNTLQINDYQYVGNGTFTFNYTWKNTPFQITDKVIANATLTVLDTTFLSAEETQSINYPSSISFMMSFLYAGIIVLTIVLIFERHLITEWDTDKSTKDHGIMPTTITGKGG